MNESLIQPFSIYIAIRMVFVVVECLLDYAVQSKKKKSSLFEWAMKEKFVNNV